MKHLVTALLFSVLLAIPPAMAQIGAKGSLEISMDVARFYGDTSQVYVEIYYGIRENSITYAIDSGRYTGAVNMEMLVRSDTVVVAKKEWTVPHILTDTAKMKAGQQLMGIESVGLPPGNYMVSLSGYDLRQPGRRDSVATELQVEKYPSDREALSDIEFCTLIRQSTDKSSIFYKNTLDVIPNAGRLYGSGLPIIYYYLEVYNLKPTGAHLNIHTAIVDISGREVLAHDKAKPRTHPSSVEVGTMNISTLHSGTYVLRASLVDTVAGVLATREKKFYVYKPGARPDTSGMAGGRLSIAAMDFYTMSDSAVMEEFAEASYLANEPERQQFQRLTDLRAKQNFLYEFWQRRNTDTLTALNTFRDQYLERVRYANENYASGFRNGWKSDRGRVYIVYGPPSEIDRHPSSQESLPYEIWNYHELEGGVMFVFVDRTNSGMYQLVHSTARSEIRDDSWFDDYARRMH